jgi:PKD repeat protein/subtilisin-like proprotein convertase family protein
MKKLITLLALIICALWTTISAQTVVTMGGSTTNVSGCNFVIYDHGGLQGNYGPNRNDLLTITSNSSSAHCVQIKIILTDFDVHPSDTLYVYDGTTDDDSLLLAALNNDVVASAANDVIYTATVLNPSGAITLKFVSDADSIGSGYVINTSCVAPCQRVDLEIDPVLSSHYPHLAEDGFYYVDLCEHDTLHMVVHGVFPDNDFSYHQDDITSNFIWDLGIETIEGVGMNVLDYFFESGRGYDIAISNVDSAGCPNYSPQIFRIRTSKNPIRRVSQLPAMCTGDVITVSSTYSNLSVVQVDSVYSEQLTTLKVTDTVFIPDGEECAGICAYESPVTFTAFSPSATIQSADDILYVRVKMEHSFIGDIYISLTCPPDPTTGVRRSAKILQKYGSSTTTDCSGYIPLPWGWQTTGSSGADFGVVGPTNSSSNRCSTIENPMGTTWNYCWSNNTALGYQYASGLGLVYESTHVTNGIVDSSNMTNMTNIYHPDDSFSSLIGCPMNGTWAITVVDGWYGDNGYITEWEMALDPSLLPQDWSYTVHPDSTWVEGPGATGAFIIPDSSGLINYTVHVMDEFRCIYDTLLGIEVVERPHPDLGPDIAICHGELYELDSHYDNPNSKVYWNTGEHTPTIFLTSAGDYAVRVAVTNEEGLTCVGTDTVNVYVSPKPIPEFTVSDTAGCAPLSIHFTNTSIITNDTMGMSFRWVIYDENGNIVSTSNKINPDLQFDNEGLYTVKLVVITDEGCTDSIIKYNYLTINYQPMAEFDALPEVSLWSETNGSINFQVQGDTLDFGDDMGFYWDFGDGSIDSSSYALEHSYNSWGDYDVTLFMFTPQGCNSSITHTVSLEADLIFPNVITPNGDGVNDVFAIGNLNTSMNNYDPDKYRNNELTIYDRWGKQVYHALNYDTFKDMTGERGDGIIVGEQVFDASKVNDGTYYFTFYYKGKLKTVNYHGTLQIIRDR